MTVLDPDEETFVAYVAFSYIKNRFRVRQMFQLHQGLSPGFTMKLLKLTGINNHAIDLIENKHTLSDPVYKLGGARNSENLR